jgi:4-alpha-glucanotransferase
VATTGTHDTESSLDWWQELPEWERKSALVLPKLREAAPTLDEKNPGRMSEAMWRALLATVIESPSRAVLLPVQDVLRVRDRINTPNTVGPENWSHRLSWTVSALTDDSILRGRMRIVRAYNEASGRV